MLKCQACGRENVEGTPMCRNCGAELPEVPQTPSAESGGEPGLDDAELLALVNSGQKIQAVKLYRERYGVGLAEAKDAVEALVAGRTIDASSDDAEVLALMKAGKKIDAIKVYRECHGGGLKEAKDAVEELARQHGIASQSSGCAGVLLLGILGFAAGAAYLLA